MTCFQYNYNEKRQDLKKDFKDIIKWSLYDLCATVSALKTYNSVKNRLKFNLLNVS